jgi:hypothetical protein
MCQITPCSVFVSECVRSLSMFSLSRAIWHILKHKLNIESNLTYSERQTEHRKWSDTFWNTSWTLRVIWHILKHKLNIKSDLTHSETQTEHREQSDIFWKTNCLCFRMCQIAFCVQFVFQNVSDHFWCSVLCFIMCRITFYVQFVIQNVSDHS